MQIEQVPAHEWERWTRLNGGIVLDVREPHERAGGTLPGAIGISMMDLPSSLSDLDESTPTLVVCRSGARSQQAAMFLIMSGFHSVANLAGGLKALELAQ